MDSQNKNEERLPYDCGKKGRSRKNIAKSSKKHRNRTKRIRKNTIAEKALNRKTSVVNRTHQKRKEGRTEGRKRGLKGTRLSRRNQKKRRGCFSTENL